jgi:hypothetical protein
MAIGLESLQEIISPNGDLKMHFVNEPPPGFLFGEMFWDAIPTGLRLRGNSSIQSSMKVQSRFHVSLLLREAS